MNDECRKKLKLNHRGLRVFAEDTEVFFAYFAKNLNLRDLRVKKTLRSLCKAQCPLWLKRRAEGAQSAPHASSPIYSFSIVSSDFPFVSGSLSHMNRKPAAHITAYTQKAAASPNFFSITGNVDTRIK
jgi:hypothetical protein